MNVMRIWTLVTVVLIGAILGLGWLLGVSPLLAQAAESDTERASVEITNSAQEATLALMKSQHDEIGLLMEDLQELNASIPSSVDTETVYELLADYQTASGASPSLISLGEAVQYGIPVEGPETTAADAPASGSAPQGALATTLYMVPVTISFGPTGVDKVMAFVRELQQGPRLFLVTSVISSPETASITAHLFVIYDGTTPVIVAPPQEVDPEPTPTPTPGETETAAPTDSPSPTPTP